MPEMRSPGVPEWSIDSPSRRYGSPCAAVLGEVGEIGEVVKARIRGWSENTETSVVLVLAFGLPIVGSLYALVSLERSTPPITSPHLLRLLVSELVLGALIASLLKVRGWTPTRLGLRPTWSDVVWGLLLVVASYVAYYAVWIAVANLWSGFTRAVASTHLVAREIPLPISVAVSIVNPIFEEVFVCGYVIAALKGRIGTAGAVNVSMGIRLVCHLYQGPVGVVSIVPIGLVYAFYFARTGRLWPVILAHAVEDLLGLLYGR
jgi:CAAX protease family protein